MEQIAVTRSIIAADAFTSLVEAAYELRGPITCKLISKMLRSQDNDHYLITAGGQEYVARIYQSDKHLGREESDYLFELDWLTFLKDNELPVSYPIAQKDGSYLGHVNAPEGLRYYALFSFAPGRPMSVNDEEQLFTAGSKMAEIHLASNSFRSQHARQQMDISFLLDHPMERILEFWAGKRDNRLEIVLSSAEEARVAIMELLENEENTHDSWGPIGGDFHPYNTHFDNRGEPTFFNFDLCGFGWRAYDIAVFLLNANLIHKSSNLSEAFFAGYYSVRPLSQNEHEAIAPFLTIRRVWLSGKFSTLDGIAGYTFVAPALMDNQ